MAVGVALKSKKNVSNLWFVGFLICSAVVMLVKLLYHTGYIINFPHWFKLNYPLGLLRPVFIFLYIHFLLNGLRKIKPKHLLHFIPFFILVIYLMPFLLQDADYKLSVLQRELQNQLGVIPFWYVYFQMGYTLCYLLLVLFDLKKISSQQSKISKQKAAIIRWVKFLFLGGIIYLLASVILKLSGLTGDYNYYLYEVFSIMLILLCVKLLTLSEFFNANNVDSEKYKNSMLDEKSLDMYFKRIESLMATQKLFKQTDLKLIHIAEFISLPEYQVSQIINQKSGLTFRNYINAYRVKAAKEKLVKSLEQYSIEGIARDVGFNSRASFYNAFKKETNLTPSEFVAYYR